MKNFIIPLLFTSILFAVTSRGFSQKTKPDIFFNELIVMGSYTTVSDDHTENGIGFGAGLYKSLIDSNKFNLLVGLLYYRNSQIKDLGFVDRFTTTDEITYNFHYLQVPITARLYMGMKKQFFIEGGGFLAAPLYANRTGTLTISRPNQSEEKNEFNERISSRFNVGGTVGIGTLIPFSKFGLLLKSSYTYGALSIYEDSRYLSLDFFDRFIQVSVGIQL